MDTKKTLINKLLEEHGDVKIALNHNFLAYERSRDDKNVIVGFSYQHFGDAKTTVCQYTIPIEMWEDIRYFVTVKDYVTKRNMYDVLVDRKNGNITLVVFPIHFMLMTLNIVHLKMTYQLLLK